jgi:hypothetical protein
MDEPDEPPGMGEVFTSRAGSGAGMSGAPEATVKTGGATVWVCGLIRCARKGGGRGATFFWGTSGDNVAVISDMTGLRGEAVKDHQISDATSTYRIAVRIPAIKRLDEAARLG